MRVPPKKPGNKEGGGGKESFFLLMTLWPDGCSPILSVSPSSPCSKIDNKKIIIIK